MINCTSSNIWWLKNFTLRKQGLCAVWFVWRAFSPRRYFVVKHSQTPLYRGGFNATRHDATPTFSWWIHVQFGTGSIRKDRVTEWSGPIVWRYYYALFQPCASIHGHHLNCSRLLTIYTRLCLSSNRWLENKIFVQVNRKVQTMHLLNVARLYINIKVVPIYRSQACYNIG